MKRQKGRTLKQNRALHLFFNHLAEELNDAGLDMRKTLKPGIDISWNSTTIKEYLFRPIMKAQLGITSTTQLTTKNIDEVFDTINRHLGERFGLHVPFPSINSLLTEEDK